MRAFRSSFASSFGAGSELSAAFCGLHGGLDACRDDSDGCDTDLTLLSAADLLRDVLSMPGDTDGMLAPWESNVSPHNMHNKYNTHHFDSANVNMSGCDFESMGAGATRTMSVPRPLASDLDLVCWPELPKLDAGIWQGILDDNLRA